MNLAKDITWGDAVSELFLEVNSDCGINDVIHSIPSSTERI
jgi:hypothetical protein